MLVELKIQFINQHPLNGYLYDFYLPKHNLLIEVDGDWFHCNPDVYPEAIHEIQKFVIENDERKNLVAKENNTSTCAAAASFAFSRGLSSIQHEQPSEVNSSDDEQLSNKQMDMVNQQMNEENNMASLDQSAITC